MTIGVKTNAARARYADQDNGENHINSQGQGRKAWPPARQKRAAATYFQQWNSKSCKRRCGHAAGAEDCGKTGKREEFHPARKQK